MSGAVSRARVQSFLRAWLDTARRWQLPPDAGRHAGGLRCPAARTTLQWTEFLTLPVAVSGPELGLPEPEAACFAAGLVAYLARVQRPDGSFDAGFCGDLQQACNAAFALRPLSDAFRRWPPGFGEETRATLRGVLLGAAEACIGGGMNTANHRWVAAGGLVHAADALDEPRLRAAGEAWTRAGIDIDADGGFSEGSPNYALVSADHLLDLEEMAGRRDLGDLARRSVGWLRALALPHGGFATVTSSRYDTEGSTDAYARAAVVCARLGAHELVPGALARVFAARTGPGTVAPTVGRPVAAVGKAKNYPATASAHTACHLLRWLRDGAPGAAEPGPAPAPRVARLAVRGVHRATLGPLTVVAGSGRNLLEAHVGSAALEGMRLLAHVTGWNALWTERHESRESGFVLQLSTAPGSDAVRLPQHRLEAPDERRPGPPVPPVRAELVFSAGPAPEAQVAVALSGPEGAHAVLELAARPDQELFDGDGLPLPDPASAPPAGRTVLRGPAGDLLLLEHEGGSGHALALSPYGYGDGDALWSPSFHPRSLRIGLELPTRLVLRLTPG